MASDERLHRQGAACENLVGSLPLLGETTHTPYAPPTRGRVLDKSYMAS
jgi:hypothetical protein